MKKSVKTWLSIAVFPLIILPVLLWAACAGAAPRDLEINVEFPVKLIGGQLDPSTIRVGQDDKVTLKIESDQPGALHLHGYDLDHEVKSGEVTDFVFVADASGRFRIAFHLTGEDTTSHEGPGYDEVTEASHDDPVHPKEVTASGHHHEESGDVQEIVEEIEVGFLEVQPR